VVYVPSSCILFHGPGAEEVGYKEASAFGRLLPFTGSSLKKEGARELVGILSHRPVGSGRASVLVGPVDEVNPATADVLLKTIEEFDPSGTRPFLWAWDLGGVSHTLRSRCILRFCPGTDTRTEAHGPEAVAALKAYMDGDWVTLTEEVKDQDDLDLLLRAVVDLLAPKLVDPSPDPRYVALWDVLRPLFGSGTLTPARVVSAFLLADQRGQP
jgi:hypothetical protein